MPRTIAESTPVNPAYRWVDVEPERQRFLKPLFDHFGSPTLRVWLESSVAERGLDRAGCAGLVTATGACDGRRVAIAWSDFRVNAASYGRTNSRRFAAFLRQLDAEDDAIPLLYFVTSAGVSLMEGRTAFSDAFHLWPELLHFGERHPLLTCAAGKCLGLAPVLFALGHYRVAIVGETRINLTGPEVIRLFFGEGVDFEARAAAERCVERHDLIHELVPSVEGAVALFRAILAARAGDELGAARSLGSKTRSVLLSLLDAAPLELVPGWCPRVRLFLGRRRGKPLGIFINPPDRSDNLITVRTLEKYAAGLDLFRALGLPIVSLLDSPGFDPRFEQSDASNIRQILRVGEKIMRYPHGTMGIVVGRCFGGSASLGFPKIFGSRRVVALRGSTFGLMCTAIVERLLRGSPRLWEEWKRTAQSQGPGLEDLVDEGSLDAVVEPGQLPAEVDRFLAGLDGGMWRPSAAPQRPGGTAGRPRRSHDAQILPLREAVS